MSAAPFSEGESGEGAGEWWCSCPSWDIATATITAKITQTKAKETNDFPVAIAATRRRSCFCCHNRMIMKGTDGFINVCVCWPAQLITDVCLFLVIFRGENSNGRL